MTMISPWNTSGPIPESLQAAIEDERAEWLNRDELTGVIRQIKRGGPRRGGKGHLVEGTGRMKMLWMGWKRNAIFTLTVMSITVSSAKFLSMQITQTLPLEFRLLTE